MERADIEPRQHAAHGSPFGFVLRLHDFAYFVTYFAVLPCFLPPS